MANSDVFKYAFELEDQLKQLAEKVVSMAISIGIAPETTDTGNLTYLQVMHLADNVLAHIAIHMTAGVPA